MDDRKHSISPDTLYARLGSQSAPIIVDVRRDADFAGADRLVADAFHRSPDHVEQWRTDLPSGRQVVTYCIHGREVSQGVAAALRLMGVEANFLEGGIADWTEQGMPTRRNIGTTPSKWVTREHPKIDRIACPWLVRRFIDPNAEFIYVPKDQVLAVAQQTGGIPYDIDGVEFTHEGERCSFDTILRVYEIKDPALDHLATIVRGADTSRHDLSPQCGGLFAIRSVCPRIFRTTTKCSSTAWSSTTRYTRGAARCKPRRTIGRRPSRPKRAFHMRNGEMTYAMKPLSCDPARIKGMSERLIISHYENNYGGAVKRLNLIEEKLAELDYATAPGFLINGLKREELVAMNSMILHEHFFDSLGDASEPDAALQEVLTRDFGSFERWRSEFTAMGKALGGGSGWVLLSWSPRDRKLVNQWASDHCHTLAGGAPILALDMYEHSYHIDFGAKAADYVGVFMAAINWPAVRRAYDNVRS